MAKIVLIGASGFVGSAVLKEALDRGHEVTALVRNPEKITITSDKLMLKAGDVQSKDTLAELAKGADAVLSAFNPGWENPNIYEDTLTGYRAIIDGTKAANVGRLLIVGGAGTLFVKPNVRVLDIGILPEAILPGVESLAKVYYDYLQPEKDIDWVFFSPAGNIEPGTRTGNFRLGKDDLIVDADENSNISVEDYALALIDELENPAHHQERFTIGY